MNCLITGASVGIGASLAVKMAKNGYNLFLTYYSNQKLCEELKQELETKYNIKCFIQKYDLKEEEDIIKLSQTIKEKFGILDILVNNASTSNDNLFMDKTKKEFMEVLEVNLLGTFLTSKYLIPLMEKGVIINMASTDGIDTYNIYNTDYAVSKAGIIQLTKSMALIFKDLKVLAIAPNWVDTESTKEMSRDYLQQELKRIGQKELISREKVVDVIYDTIINQNIRSGEVIKIYE